MQKFATPLGQASTSSLEALQAYSVGHNEHQQLHEDKAIPYLKRAIELDPNFAMAYATLGVIYNNQGSRTVSRDALQKAFDHREGASEHEKLYISAHYYESSTGEIDKRRTSMSSGNKLIRETTCRRTTCHCFTAPLASRTKSLANPLLKLCKSTRRTDSRTKMCPAPTWPWDAMTNPEQLSNRQSSKKPIRHQRGQLSTGIYSRRCSRDAARIR
ncbi:MAG: tetratricopeptide repeat protein [Terriglobales bacterium]